MVTETAQSAQSPSWQRELARAYTRPEDLLRALDLDPTLLDSMRTGARLFSLRVPRGYVRRMRRADAQDPLLRQVLPIDAESRDIEGFSRDPVGELPSAEPGGILHKYDGRALLITTGACAVHCRYCFRRHFPYADHHAGIARWEPALDYLGQCPDITEVILSGGDPLSLTDRRLAELSEGLAAIPHVRRLRLHTRTPVVLPERVDDRLLGWLRCWGNRAVVVLHANHPREIDDTVADAAARLRSAGAWTLNQAVLLRGVNDTSAALVALSERLFDAGILPYYLHALDPVAGAAHFDLPDTEAKRLVARAAEQLPGYLVPRLVRELAGGAAKTLIAPDLAHPG